MAKELIDAVDIQIKALTEIRKYRSCSDVISLTVYRIGDDKTDSNWGLSNLRYGIDTDERSADRA